MQCGILPFVRPQKQRGVANFALAMVAACDNGGQVRDGKNDSI
jgi:hypothetical protein